MKRIILILPLLTLLLIIITGLTALYRHNNNGTMADKLRAGEKIIMPQFSLPELNNLTSTFSNQDLRGKYSLINVFASWCSSCIAEHGLLMELARDSELENKIDIYGVAWRDINKNSENYLAKNGNPYLKIAVDNKALFSKLLSVSGTPESFLVDPRGQVIYYWRGAIDKNIILNLVNVN